MYRENEHRERRFQNYFLKYLALIVPRNSFKYIYLYICMCMHLTVISRYYVYSYIVHFLTFTKSHLYLFPNNAILSLDCDAFK